MPLLQKSPRCTDPQRSRQAVQTASACSFYTTFLPTFHAASTQDSTLEDHPENLPILDTGAARCLLPFTWLGAEECEKAKKRIHLKMATGTTVRALLFNNVIYGKSVTRPLISVGQLKGMLDLRMIWDDALPLIVVCYAGKKYVLLQANVVHRLPLVSRQELRVILNAIHDFTVKGELWNIHKWNAALNKTLDVFFWTNPDWSPPRIAMKIEETKEPKVMFSSLDAASHNINTTLISPPKTLTTKEVQEIIMKHSLPKATSRKNVQLPGYVPEGRLLGAFTTRGEGIIQVTNRYRRVEATHHLASLRGGEAKTEGYLSAQKCIEPRDCKCTKTRIATAPHGSYHWEISQGEAYGWNIHLVNIHLLVSPLSGSKV